MDFDMASHASAIDDSFFPVNVNQTNAAIPSGDYQGDPQDTGLRSGHWTVLSTANGSGIDDRIPTATRAPSVLEDGVPSSVQRIDRTVLRKLAAATEKDRKAKEDEAKIRAGGTSTNAETQLQMRPKAEKEKKGFYIPKAQGISLSIHPPTSHPPLTNISNLSNARGIRIRARDGKDEIVKHPMPRPISTVNVAHKKTETKGEIAKVAGPPSPLATLRSASITSHASKRTANLVRIVGKNGEESFVELPFIPGASNPVSATQPEVQSPPREPAVADFAKEKKKRDSAAEREAKRLRDKRVAAEEKQKRNVAAEREAKQLREDRMAAEAMMHGALPASSKASTVAIPAKQSKSSSRLSEQQTSRVFDMTSEPASVASSKTSIAKTASVQETAQEDFANGSKARSKHSSVAGWQEVGFRTYEPAASTKDKSTSPRDTAQPKPTTAPRKSIPSTFTGRLPTPEVAASVHKSFASKPASFQYSYRHSSNSQKLSAKRSGVDEQPEEAPPSEHTESRTSLASVDSFPLAVPQSSNHSSLHLWQQSDIGIRTEEQGPTVFAGRGWISPHPLSEAPTWAREEPDPVIQLPSGAAIRAESGVETITYEEWLAVQHHTNSTVGSRAAALNVHTAGSQTRNCSEARGADVVAESGRRNISIAESHATRQYAAGSWGFRAGDPSGQRNYRTPTVKTESAAGSGHRAFQRSDIAESAGTAVRIQDEDGNAKTWLEMPWDERASKREGKGDRLSDWF